MTTVLDSESVRKRADWMVPADDVILELLRSEGNLTPEVIDDMGGPSPNHVINRCRQLEKYGLVEKLGRGLYRLTDEGRAYLDEELDASELEPSE